MIVTDWDIRFNEEQLFDPVGISYMHTLYSQIFSIVGHATTKK